MGLLDTTLKRVTDERVAIEIAKQERVLKASYTRKLNQERAKIPALVKSSVAAEFEKSVQLSTPNGPMIRRNSLDPHLNDQNNRKRPGSDIPYDTLRRFSRSHEMSRICINARKRQITSLEWDIVSADPEDKTDYNADIDLVKAYFKNLGGYRMRFNKLQDTLIEDLLVLDAAVLYKQRDRKGDILYYMPVDATTIKLRVDPSGNTPEPPEIAYIQYVRGQNMGEYTADQMMYDMINPRTDSPYGLAPLESLIMVVTSALKSTLYNLDFLTSGNIPEGLLTLPENWSVKQIDEYMTYFDALVAGDSSQTSKMKPIPGGSVFTETHKRSDMAFQEFNNWLMMLTCAMFDIQPQEIGFTLQINKANGSEQNDITTRKGILPLCNLLAEMWNDAIQIDLGFPHLKFAYLGLEDRDQLMEAQANQIRLNSGVVTVDEVRKESGLDPIGVDKPYVLGTPVFLSDAIINPQTETPINEEGAEESIQSTEAHDSATAESGPSDLMPGKSNTPVDELRRIEKYALKRIKLGKAYRPFASDILLPTITEELNSKLAKCNDSAIAKTIIRSYQSRGEPLFLAKGDDEPQDYEHNPHFDQVLASLHFKKFESDFKKAILAQAVWTASKLSSIEDKYLSQDMTADEQAGLRAYLVNNMPSLASEVDASLVAAWYVEVANIGVNSLYDTLGASTVFNLTNEAYKNLLSQKAEGLLTKSSIDDTTRKQLANFIVKERADGKTIPELVKDIEANFEDISSWRATAIARTETVNMLNQGQYKAMQEVGVTVKAWVNYGPNPCPVCEMNAGDGYIPMDSFFSSGDLMPAAHVACECGLDYDVQQVSLADLWNGE